jgi:class 3 adenylate cyclase
MDRIWQWVWDRFRNRYSWAAWAVASLVSMPVYLFWSSLVIAVEGSSRYVPAALVTVAAVPVLGYVNIQPGRGWGRLVDNWAAGQGIDRATALDASYAWSRGIVIRMVASNAVCIALLSVIAGALAGAAESRLIQYGILGVCMGIALGLSSVHNVVEAAVRPVRVAIAADTGTGDSLPRSHPSFAAWSNAFVVSVVFIFAVDGAMLAAIFSRALVEPALFIAIGVAMAVVFGVPFTVGLGFSPSLAPLRDLAAGTERVGAGDYSRRLPVVQDDDLGALAASFNRMQAGLAERQRLQAAFGTYVDPGLAARLLEQGDDIFTGERREVTVMFVDIRDFTPFAEANTAEDTVARLNAVFEVVVPAVVDAGGHVNKFLGDGALAVFGAPNDLADHADAAVSAAVLIDRLVAERFGGALRVGIGINTGVVIAGTIGGGSKLEFTLIGDTVNVAARVEQLTKTTGDTILVTQHTVDALGSRPTTLTGRGSHELKGKSTATQVFSFDGLPQG